MNTAHRPTSRIKLITFIEDRRRSQQRVIFRVCPQRSAILMHCITKLFMLLVLIAMFGSHASSVFAQSCENIPEQGSESIVASISVNGTGQELIDGMLVPAYTQLRIDSVASAFGTCTGMQWVCNGGCSCQPTGYIYQRDVNHTHLYVEMSTNQQSGNYQVGNVWPDYSPMHVVDSSSSDTSGPNYYTPPYAGTYKFHIQAIINGTPCSLEPYEIETTITIYVGDNDRTVNAGENSCSTGAGPTMVGEPVNVTTGNTYLKQTDYLLPGKGDGLEITRHYNSHWQRTGLFGYGWSSILDESINAYGTSLLRLNLPDGRAVYLGRTAGVGPYIPKGPLDFYGQVVKNADNTYTLTLPDGRVHQFNTSGKLTSFADRNGNTITLTLNASGKPTTITDASGRIVTLTYDSYGLINSMSDSLGSIATYTHIFYGRLSVVTYPDGSKYTFTDQFQGSAVYLTSVKDALNNVLESHTYDSQGRALTSSVAGNGTELYTLTYVSPTETHVTDALNRVTKYFFDTTKLRNLVTRVEGNCGCGNSQISQWTYDNNLNVTSKTDALNRTTTFTYDTNGNRLTQTDATGTITYTYSPLGDVLTVTDQLSGVWTNTYDAAGNLLTTKDPLNNQTTLTYDGSGQLLTITDPRNNTTTFTYDTSGNLTRRTDALNNQTNIGYDARSRVTSVTNALNQVTSYEYDLAGRLKKVIYPDTNFVLFTYDLAGRRTKIKDPRGYETTFVYDAAYRLTSETNANNKTTSYAYDLMSNLTGVTDALNRTTNYEFDDFNRLKKIKYPEATAGAGRLEENFGYDLVGNLITKTDQSGRVTTFCYDNSHRLTSTIDPAQKTTAYEYNARSQMTAVVDTISQRYEFVYDPLGRVTQNKKGTATMSFVYDAAGNRSQRTDYNGAITNYSFDALNHLTTISYPDTTSASYGYDVLSRLTTATNPTGTVTIAYDNRSRMSSVTDVFGQVVSYQYDANSNRTQLSLNGATNATYQYDVINRLTQITDNVALNVGFAYDATNKLTSRTLPNGVVSTYQYDGLDRLTRLTHAKAPNTLLDLQYQFNTVNNITQMIDLAGTHNYSYDTLDRLTAATHPNQPNESYTYDDVGNRTASHQGSSYSYQAFNHLVSANGISFSYDTNGNQTSKSDANGSWSYTWDYENRLKQATLSGGVSVTYSYDALGRRVQRSSSVSGTEKYVYDGADVVRDLDSVNAIVAEYLNGPGIDNKLRQTSSGNSSFFLPDHLGTTRALADASGTVTSSLSYDSFGNVASGSGSTRYTYTGRESDADIGLMYYRARWYEPQEGRFIAEDQIGLTGGINLFAYVNNSPFVFRDPLGLCPETKKPKCTQDKSGRDRADIELLLLRAGLTDLIEEIRPSTINPEGLVFDITNRQAFLDALMRNKAFKYDTPYNTEHTKDVNGSAVDSRSVTGEKGLGKDTQGVDRSLQVAVGPVDPTSGGAIGYADLDCDNPAQGPIKALKHGLPILGRRIRRIFN
jgi:RHS repeat-associated protein